MKIVSPPGDGPGKDSEVTLPPSPPSPRILVVTKRLDVGGTERHLARVLPGLKRRGLDITVFVLERGGALEHSLVEAGIPVYGMKRRAPGRWNVVPAWLRLVRVLRRLRPTIVHAFLPEPYLVAGFAVPFAPPTMLLMSRRSLAEYQKRHPYLGRLERSLHRRATALLGNSREVVSELVTECREPGKVGLIFNGVETRPSGVEDGRRLRVGLGIPAAATVFVTLANLIPYKGHDDLLQALALAGPRLPQDWRWLAVGRDEGLLGTLERRAADLGVAGKVLWVGEQRDPAPFLAAADIGVLPSHEEGFSNALLEKMAQGLAVVATDVGGNPDAVIAGETGLLVPPRSPAALAEALVRLANDPALARTLGDNAARLVAAQFSLSACMDRYERLYRGLGPGELGSILDPPPSIRPQPESADDACQA